MRKQILTPLVVLFASASLLIAVPTATAKPIGSQPAVGQPDPWLQTLYAQATSRNVQAIDPWQSNLYARKAYETRTVEASSSTGGLDRNDLGIGAGVVLAILLVGTASVVTIRRNRQPLAH